MTSYNAFSYIPVMKTDFILKTSIDKKLCQDIIPIVKTKPPKKDKKFGLF